MTEWLIDLMPGLIDLLNLENPLKSCNIFYTKMLDIWNRSWKSVTKLG